MPCQADNALRGTIHALNLGAVMADVLIDICGQTFRATVTRSIVERLALQIGDPVLVEIAPASVALTARPAR